MKRALAFVVAMLAVSGPLGAQNVEEDRRPHTYRFNVSVPVSECTFAGVPLRQGEEYAPVGAQFAYIHDQSVPTSGSSAGRTVAVIQFLRWDPKRDPELFTTFNAATAEPSAPTKTFCVDKNYFDRTVSRTYASGRQSWDLAAGVLLLPIKMRLGGEGRPFDFSRDVTLGTVVGPRWRLSPTRSAFLSVLGGAGITAVTLNASSTGGVVTENTDRAAVTLTAGSMLEVNRFQVGILLGVDRISNPNQTDWLYQGKPWLSIGLGYSLLSAPPSTPATSQ
jgi:hypothetical protein